MVAREIDPGIDVNRWLEAAAEKIGDVDGVLGCLTVAMSQEDLEVYELMGIDSEESLAEYLKGFGDSTASGGTESGPPRGSW